MRKDKEMEERIKRQEEEEEEKSECSKEKQDTAKDPLMRSFKINQTLLKIALGKIQIPEIDVFNLDKSSFWKMRDNYCDVNAKVVAMVVCEDIFTKRFQETYFMELYMKTPKKNPISEIVEDLK